ncbi:MAG: protein kinase [Chthoniobacter sp.]
MGFQRCPLGKGKIGRVYRAENSRTGRTLACKIIREGGLSDGWERELEKVRKLTGIPNVVQYHDHGSDFDAEQRPYHWVIFDFVDGDNLKKLVGKQAFTVTISFVESLISTLLDVLHACSVVGVVHGDLHAGNLLVAKPDIRIRNSRPTVLVSDFGYGGSHNNKRPKDDYQELAAIISDLLVRIDTHALNPRDKILHSLLLDFTKKRIRDTGRTSGLNPDRLHNEFDELCKKAERQSAMGTNEDDAGNRKPADYLWAEALGSRIEEWKNLFVPNFLAANDLLARTNTVLTGARGCGKTMSFRRLTKLMDSIIGEPSGVPGAGAFTGFYLNCRDLSDAFPWVPQELKPPGEVQVIHFFHLAWLSEVLKTLAFVDQKSSADYAPLEGWFSDLYGDRFIKTAIDEDILAHLRAFVEQDKERCHVASLGKGALEDWPLGRFDFLDQLFDRLVKILPWLATHPIYLFLDDYTIPVVPKAIQLALNPIIFRRRSEIFFKVSTEAANSFIPTGPNKKPLELHHDFALLDLATESLHQDEADKAYLLDQIFRPRIRRHHNLSHHDYGLEDVLGITPYSNNELAWQMRKGVGDDKQRVMYHGKRVFVGLWTSDIRTMVEMFNDMLREANGSVDSDRPLIAKELQDRCIRNQGGEMMTFTQSIRDYELWKLTSGKRDRAEKFGLHLKTIVEAFIAVSRYELLEGKTVGNQGRDNPRQAFRIEVVDSFAPDRAVRGYLDGLVRYHIFLQDWRGKSQRGMLTPRFYLNRVILPYGGLTLSSHDHIQLKNVELNSLLGEPNKFLDYWKKKRQLQRDRKRDRDAQSDHPEFKI